MLIGEKTLLKKKDVDYIHVSHYEELAVKNLWGDLKEDKELNVYFPDELPKDRYPCREYFFNILNTLYPDYLQKIMAHAAKERYSAEGEEQQKHVIKATDEWYEALQAMPFKSSKTILNELIITIFNIVKPGKTLHLLK